MAVGGDIPSPWGQAALNKFLEHYMYAREAFLLDSIESADKDLGVITATVASDRPLLVTPYQIGDPIWHPRHVSGADLLMMTVSLGSLHAYFFHERRWDDGWVGFGNRMKNVTFRNLAKVGAPLRLESKELRVRKGSQRTLIEFQFEFSQGGKLIYESEQTAMFLRQSPVL